ncbi:MAG: hypothetical protein IJK04_11870 [Kiritimatiellae bacterium]|nr:hypothetical protein [Kiritimatiellia bacterium]
MTAPAWMDAVIGEFGRAAGLGGLSLGEAGVAALRFENGAALRLEYTGSELVVAMTFPRGDLKRLLSFAHPKAAFGFRARCGILPKTGEFLVAVRLAERDVTLPRLNDAFALLWRLAGETGGGSWA